MTFDEWWESLPDGWPVTKPWKNIARAAWDAALESESADCCVGAPDAAKANSVKLEGE